eukprot:SAG11_NODE_740_length_7421_cov_6.264818_1_plen_288_part_00
MRILRTPVDDCSLRQAALFRIRQFACAHLTATSGNSTPTWLTEELILEVADCLELRGSQSDSSDSSSEDGVDDLSDDAVWERSMRRAARRRRDDIMQASGATRRRRAQRRQARRSEVWDTAGLPCAIVDTLHAVARCRGSPPVQLPPGGVEAQGSCLAFLAQPEVLEQLAQLLHAPTLVSVHSPCCAPQSHVPARPPGARTNLNLTPTSCLSIECVTNSGHTTSMAPRSSVTRWARRSSAAGRFCSSSARSQLQSHAPRRDARTAAGGHRRMGGGSRRRFPRSVGGG